MITVTGCGDKDVVQHPGRITINPATFTLTDTGAGTTTSHQDFLITVQDSDNRARNNIDVIISAIGQEWGVVQMMTTNNEPLANPVEVKTGDAGTYIVRLQLLSGGGREYKFNLEAKSGTAYSSSALDIKAQ